MGLLAQAPGAAGGGGLGRVDGFNQHEPACKTDERGVAGVGLFAAHGDAFVSLELADRLFDARPELYSRFGKKRPRCLEFSRREITGAMPRARAATRFASLS